MLAENREEACDNTECKQRTDIRFSLKEIFLFKILSLLLFVNKVFNKLTKFVLY